MDLLRASFVLPPVVERSNLFVPHVDKDGVLDLTRAEAEWLRSPVTTASSASLLSALTVPQQSTTLKRKNIIDNDAAVDDDDDDSGSDTIDMATQEKPKAKKTKAATASTAAPPPPPPKKKANPPKKQLRINDWLSVLELARLTGVHSVTCCDPGTRNSSHVRMQLYPTFEVTHMILLDLDGLALQLQQSGLLPLQLSARPNPESDFTMEARCYALQRWIVREYRRDGGCYNSSMCYVEEQNHDRDCVRVESTVFNTFNQLAPPIRVGNSVMPAAQVLNARSVKAYYRGMFPITKGTKPARYRAFGRGDHHGDEESEEQRAVHKRNASRYGRLLFSIDMATSRLPRGNVVFRDVFRAPWTKKQSVHDHDLYDGMFMCLYVAGNVPFHFNKHATIVRRDAATLALIAADDAEDGQEQDAASTAVRMLPAFVSVPQRPRTEWQELAEFGALNRTPLGNLSKLLDALNGVEVPSEELDAAKK
jgi:hypothetical protein